MLLFTCCVNISHGKKHYDVRDPRPYWFKPMEVADSTFMDAVDSVLSDVRNYWDYINPVFTSIERCKKTAATSYRSIEYYDLPKWEKSRFQEEDVFDGFDTDAVYISVSFSTCCYPELEYYARYKGKNYFFSKERIQGSGIIREKAGSKKVRMISTYNPFEPYALFFKYKDGKLIPVHYKDAWWLQNMRP